MRGGETHFETQETRLDVRLRKVDNGPDSPSQRPQSVELDQEVT